MAYTLQKTQSVGGVTKVYAINDTGVLGNVSGNNFYPLSTYELQHDISNIQRDATGRITSYSLSGADVVQYEASEAAKAARIAAANRQKEAMAQKSAQQAQQIQQSNVAVNHVSGLPVGQTFQYAMSHNDQNKFVRENETRKSLGQATISEFQFRRGIGMNTQTIGGSYTAPKVTNNNYSGASKVVTSTAHNVTKLNAKLDTQVKGVTNTVNVVSKKAVQAKKIDAIKAQEKATGRIMLKDGTWIDPIERKGNNTGKEAITIYNSKKERDSIIAAQKAISKSARDSAKNYKKVVDKSGKVIDAVISNSLSGVGESGIRVVSMDKSGKIVASSKTARQYRDDLKTAKKIAPSPINMTTSAANRKKINEAREYLVSRGIGADYSIVDSVPTYYNTKDTSYKAPKTVQFKTVDQARHDDMIKKGGLGAASVKLNDKFIDTFSYKNIMKKLDTANTEASKALNLPTLKTIEKKRDKTLSGITVKVTQPGKTTREYTLLDKQREGQKAIYDNKYGKGVFDWTADKYDFAKAKPITTAGTVAAMYATGAVIGTVVDGALGAVSVGAGKVAAKSTSKLIQRGAAATSKHVKTAGNVGMGAAVTNEGVKVASEGDIGKTLDFISSVAIGGKGYKKSVKVTKDPISIIPGARTSKLQAITAGHNTAVEDIKVGEMFRIGGKTLLSRNAEGKIVRGASALPANKMEGKIIQSFDKADTDSFIKTIESIKNGNDASIFKSGKVISDTAYNQPRPISNPKSFDILSEHVSTDMKPVVKSTILGYNKYKLQSIDVYGSVSQKLQMGGFLSRKPQDIEISVSNIEKFIKLFKINATKSGFKEGTDYKISATDKDAPKIEFKINGKWEKGVEVFSSKVESGSTPSGYRTEDRIAFGYNKLDPIKVETAKLMKLQEQAGRKFAGATTIQKGSLEPVHAGRVKDIRDLIEIGVANEVTFKTGISKDIINYARLTSAKYKGVTESPVVRYIVEVGKMPNKDDLSALTDGKLSKIGLSKLTQARKSGKQIKIDDIVNDVSRNHTVSKQGASKTRRTKYRRQATGKKRKVAEDKEIMYSSKKLNVSKKIGAGGVSKSVSKLKSVKPFKFGSIQISKSKSVNNTNSIRSTKPAHNKVSSSASKHKLYDTSAAPYTSRASRPVRGESTSKISGSTSKKLNSIKQSKHGSKSKTNSKQSTTSSVSTPTITEASKPTTSTKRGVYKSGSITTARRHVLDEPIYYKYKQKRNGDSKRTKNIIQSVKRKRTIYNKLGSLDTFFETEKPKKKTKSKKR